MTQHLLTFALTVFTGFFAIMNPIANTPIFLGLVEDKNEALKKEIAKTATLTAFLIVFVFVVLGKYIFQLFGISIPAFKITGGVLIFVVGFEMLMSQKSKIHGQASSEDPNIAVSPLAIPILAGPGTIVTAMNYTTGADILHTSIVLGVFAVMTVLTYIAFVLGETLVEKIGSNIIMVIGKLMGLILAIIGVQMITAGIKISFGL